ncbi:MAG TPA: hypothetical protein VGD83_28810 [Streptosporangiaceae bacterium]
MVLPQGHDRQNADDAGDDDGGFQKTAADIAQGDAFVLPLDDGYSVTAVPITAMARITSDNAPKNTRVSAPAPRM